MSLKCRRKIAGCNPCESKDKIDFLTNLALGTLWGVVVRKQNSLPRPPVFPNSKFFSKIFQRYRSAKLHAIFKTIKPLGNFIPSNSLEPLPTEMVGYRLLFHSVIGFHNLTANLFTAKPRYAQGLLRYENRCFNDYADN